MSSDKFLICEICDQAKKIEENGTLDCCELVQSPDPFMVKVK